MGHMLRTHKDARPYLLSQTEIGEIKALRDSKFSTWEWNFGYSPKYQFYRSIPFIEGRLELHMNVEKGVIRELKILGDFNSRKDLVFLEEMLVGTIHDPETLRNKLSGINVADYISGLGNEELLMGMF